VKPRWIVVALLAAALAGVLGAPRVSTPVPALPASMTDREFWQFLSEASEPGGYFRDANIVNLTSNEIWFQSIIPGLVAQTTPGSVYIGVGPEQNFTYIAALRPKLAVVVDIRRGNLDLQLMYKALFELARDRAEFVAMLFARERPAGLTARSTAAELFAAFARAGPHEPSYLRNLSAIEDRLMRVHGFPLEAEDLAAIREIYRVFHESGFAVRSSPTYDALMTATDDLGEARSYLSTEERFAFVKDLQERNLVLPVVGDFSGPKAIRAVGRYLKQHGAVVSAFYLSNVEEYLEREGSWNAFCENVATLPLDSSSSFIRSSDRRNGFSRGFHLSLGRMAVAVRSCRASARYR
jgi:hypothetical protein